MSIANARFSLVLVLLLGATLLWPSESKAQATSWLYAGGGTGAVERGQTEVLPLVQVDSGLGTSARYPVVVGGLFRFQGYVGGGLDLGVVSRVVSRGFAQGGYGAGIDIGVSQRWWGARSTALIGSLVLGAPWGLTVNVGASSGSGDQRTAFATVGIDFARLTVHRASGLNWMQNPMRSPTQE
jgi:hypothetical protein